jgi:rRNA maturation endonuclease Nob1
MREIVQRVYSDGYKRNYLKHNTYAGTHKKRYYCTECKKAVMSYPNELLCKDCGNRLSKWHWHLMK